MSRLIDLTGQTFSRLIVIKRVENDKYGHTRWLCQCKCGKRQKAQGGHLRAGCVQSCGCLQKEISIQVGKQKIKHGHNCRNKRSKTYVTWVNMIYRCTNPNVKNYKDYGGRGIKVCKRWLRFENFLEDMRERPKGFTLDRVNSDGDYCKGNCKWSTPKEQARNTRKNKLITINGIMKCLAEHCEDRELNYHTVYYRLQHKWTPEEALELVPRKKK